MLVYFYLVFIGIAFLSSLNAFRLDFPLHLKVFSVLLGLDFLVEFSATVIVNLFHIRTNVPLYNCFMLVETMTYAWFFRTILTNRLLKGTDWRLSDPVSHLLGHYRLLRLRDQLSGTAVLYIVESLFTVCMAAIFYYQLFTAPTLIIRLTTSPEFWIATGLIIFYTCNLPYLGMLNFITKRLPIFSKGAANAVADPEHHHVFPLHPGLPMYQNNNDKYNEVISVLITGTLLFVILTGIILFVFLFYQKKRFQHREQLAELQSTIQQELLKTQLETQENTFRQIGEELHDNVGQLLSSTRILLVIAQRSIAEPPDSPANHDRNPRHSHSGSPLAVQSAQ